MDHRVGRHVRAGGSLSNAAAAEHPQAGWWNGTMRRIVSVWFPHWHTDAHYWRRRTADGNTRAPADRDGGAGDRPHRPFALVERTNGGVRLTAVDPLAAAEGLSPGMMLADARAAMPDLAVANADPAADSASLRAFSDWGR